MKWACFWACTCWAGAISGQDVITPTRDSLSLDSTFTFRSLGAIERVAVGALHPGMVHYPAQLTQGMVAGLSVARPGGDPNEGFRMRLRGIASITGAAEPLVVIDGIPGAALETVDPLDIASISVLKDAASAARYGIRGGSGVLLIETKQAAVAGSQTEWVGMAGTEQAVQRLPVLSAAAYRPLPGATDLGSDTDWMREVTRNGGTQVQHLAWSNRNTHMALRGSMNFRQVAGVGLSSGFQQLNARVHWQQQAFKERLTWHMSLASTLKEAQLGTPDIFRYALTTNPTMPVYDDRDYSPTAGAAYGGFAQQNIFDAYNPLAIARQYIHDGKQTHTSYQAGFSYQLAPWMQLQGYTAQQEASVQASAYSPKNAKYGGGFERNGLATVSEANRQSRFASIEIQFEKKQRHWRWQGSGGYDFQYAIQQLQRIQGGNFLTDAFTYHHLGAALDFANGRGLVSSNQSAYQLAAFHGQSHLQWKKWTIDGQLRYEGASRLGIKKWGFFPGVQTRVDLSPHTRLRGSWGIAGNQPGNSYLSLQHYGAQGLFYSDGAYVPSYGVLTNANPDLRAEKTSEWNTGIDMELFKGSLNGSLDLFRRQTSDIIIPVQAPVPPNLAVTTWMNAAAWQHQGMELSLRAVLVQHLRFNWQIRGQASWMSSKIKAFSPAGNPPFQFDLGGPGQGGVDFTYVQAGEPLGLLRGPVFQGVQPDGTPILEDLNGDGTYCSCADDWKLLGNGLPSLITGLHQTLSWGSFDFELLLRGVFGHRLLNSYRLFYENNEPWSVSNYNIVTTRYYSPETRYVPASSLHVEPAGFLRLSYFTLGYRIPMKKGSVRVQLSGQNIFTISRYTGIDPEVRYPGTEAGTRLYPGIERRSIYLPTTGWSVGIEAVF